MPPRPGLTGVVASLALQIRTLEDARRQAGEFDAAERISTGFKALDRILPGQGLRRGTLVEWLAPGGAAGATSLAVAAARQAIGDERALVVIDRHHEFYAPAAEARGLDLARTLVVQPGDPRQEHWSLYQALRCGGVAAVLAWHPQLDEKGYRRLQLAAEEAGTIGLWIRSARERGSPSWADVRFGVEPLADSPLRKVRVEVLRCRGAAAGRAAEVELDDVSNPLRVVPPLAAATPASRAARA